MSSTQKRSHLNWTNLLFFSINAMVGVVGTALFMIYSHVHWETWALAGILWVLYGMGGITVGYHRLFSHQAYKAVWPVRLLLLLFGAGAFEGSILEWCTDHRNHHRYVDTDRDPYSINKGFWYAHMGWIFTLDDSLRNYDNVKDLAADPLCRLQHKFYLSIAIFMGYLLPVFLTCLWGSFLEGLVVAALRIVVLEQFTFCINSVCHFFGKKTYASTQTARDNWFAALLTFGEGYHNFHHQFPLDYRNGLRFYQYDPSKWCIFSLEFLGLASNLKRVSQVKRLRYKIQFDFSQIRTMTSSITDFIQPVYDKLYKHLLHVEAIEKSIKQLKDQNISSLNDKFAHYQSLLRDKNEQLKLARLELKYYIKSWNQVFHNTLTLNRKERLTAAL